MPEIYRRVRLQALLLAGVLIKVVEYGVLKVRLPSHCDR